MPMWGSDGITWAARFRCAPKRMHAAFLAVLATMGSACRSEMDCELNGQCVSGVCRCKSGWHGVWPRLASCEMPPRPRSEVVVSSLATIFSTCAANMWAAFYPGNGTMGRAPSVEGASWPVHDAVRRMPLAGPHPVTIRMLPLPTCRTRGRRTGVGPLHMNPPPAPTTCLRPRYVPGPPTP